MIQNGQMEADGSNSISLAADGKVCEAKCEPVELCVEKSRNLNLTFSINPALSPWRRP